MKTKYTLLIWLFLGMSCIGGMCSKDNDGGDDNGDGGDDSYVEPELKPNVTWAYLTSNDLLYTDNNRPILRKWIATSYRTAIVVPHSTGDTNLCYVGFHFEDTSMSTRFLLGVNNPGGKEVFAISLNKFSRTPGPGTYTMDIDYKEGFCWYDVYKANGDKQDSTRHQSFSSSTLSITTATALPGGKSYLISGTGSFEVIYFPTGASSSSDVHHFQLTFNKMPILYP